MQIYHNIPALNATRQMGVNTVGANKALARLSSGLRINGASDDAAGLVISEKMRALVRGLDQATKNAQDGMSMLQTAEGALNESHAILDRMYELAIQASNGTLESSDREEIQKEMDALISELDRIGNSTEFNKKSLLNGGAGLEVEFSAETVNTLSVDWISVLGGTSETTADNNNISITAAAAAQAATATYTVNADAAEAKTIEINGYAITYTAGASDDTVDAAALVAAVNAVTDKTGVVASNTGADVTLTTTDVGSSARLIVDAAAGDFATTAIANDAHAGADATITSAAISGYEATGNVIRVTDGDYKGLELKFNSDAMSATADQNLATFKITANGSVDLQIGTAEGQSMGVSISDMRAEALGVNAVDVTTVSGAQAAISAIDSAITAVSSERSKLGAYINRLEYTVKNLGATRESTTTAEGRIRDADMAKEMMEFTKFNILNQAATAMLAQANQMPQTVLQLLR